MKRNILLVLCIILCSCAEKLTTRKVRKVDLYSHTLYSTTKLSIDTSTIALSSDNSPLAHVKPIFVYQLDSLLRYRKPVVSDSFRYDYVRMCFDIFYKKGARRRVFLDAAGNSIISNNKAYRVDTAIAVLKVKYLPANKSEVLNRREAWLYTKDSHTPRILLPSGHTWEKLRKPMDRSHRK